MFRSDRPSSELDYIVYYFTRNFPIKNIFSGEIVKNNELS